MGELVTFDIVTIFPAMIEQPLAAGILGRAIANRLLDVRVRDLRDFTTDRHRVVDDVPYGGGPGMVLKPDPIFRALDAIETDRGVPLNVVLTSPQGRRFTQSEHALNGQSANSRLRSARRAAPPALAEIGVFPPGTVHCGPVRR